MEMKLNMRSDSAVFGLVTHIPVVVLLLSLDQCGQSIIKMFGLVNCKLYFQNGVHSNILFNAL